MLLAGKSIAEARIVAPPPAVFTSLPRREFGQLPRNPPPSRPEMAQIDAIVTPERRRTRATVRIQILARPLPQFAYRVITPDRFPPSCRDLFLFLLQSTNLFFRNANSAASAVGRFPRRVPRVIGLRRHFAVISFVFEANVLFRCRKIEGGRP